MGNRTVWDFVSSPEVHPEHGHSRLLWLCPTEDLFITLRNTYENEFK